MPVPVVRHADFTIYLEQIGGNTYAHADVHGRWTPRVRRLGRRAVDVLMALHGGPLHAIAIRPHNGDPKKHAKFVALMGFEFNRTVLCADGVERPVYTRWK